MPKRIYFISGQVFSSVHICDLQGNVGNDAVRIPATGLGEDSQKVVRIEDDKCCWSFISSSTQSKILRVLDYIYIYIHTGFVATCLGQRYCCCGSFWFQGFDPYLCLLLESTKKKKKRLSFGSFPRMKRVKLASGKQPS